MSFAIPITLTPRSIRTQLTLWYLLILGAALAAFAVFVFFVRTQALNREADADLALRVQRLATMLHPKLLELDLAGAVANDPRAAGEPLAIREASGLLVFRAPAFPNLAGGAEAEAVRAARRGNDVAIFHPRGGDEIRVATTLVERPGAAPLVLQLAATTEPVRNILQQLRVTMLVWFVLILAIASYGGSFIARRALRPVDAIVTRVQAIQASRLNDRLDVRAGSDELDRLVATVNDMLDRIEASMIAARRFAADASHELQTPIAAMRTALEVCLTDDRRRPEDIRETAGELLTDLDRLSALVRDLRLLALADAGHLLDQIESVDLGDVVRECADIMRAVGEPRHIEMAVEILEEVRIQGSALHLRRALMNLAHNAIQYSPDGATVQMIVGRLDDEAIVAVADDGCGIPAADLPHIFERFYRADRARARETGGTGLGLAIADQIVRGHGGRIAVSSVVDHGSTFVAYLPLATASALQTINAS